MYAETGDPIAFDVILDNCGAIEALVSALQARKKDSPYTPAPDAHLEKLKDEYLRRRAAASGPSVVQEIPAELQLRL